MARTSRGTETARKRFSEVLSWAKGRGITQTEFAERISEHTVVEIRQQYVSAYTKGREIPREVAEAIEEEFGFRSAWLLGFEDVPKTLFEESTIRISEIRDKEEKRQMAFSLLANLDGWEVEESLPISAPTGEETDVTTAHGLMFDNYATVTRDGSTVTLDRVQFDRIINQVIGVFDVLLNTQTL